MPTYTQIYDSGDLSGLADGSAIPTNNGYKLTETNPGATPEYVVSGGGIKRTAIAQANNWLKLVKVSDSSVDGASQHKVVLTCVPVFTGTAASTFTDIVAYDHIGASYPAATALEAGDTDSAALLIAGLGRFSTGIGSSANGGGTSVSAPITSGNTYTLTHTGVNASATSWTAALTPGTANTSASFANPGPGGAPGLGLITNNGTAAQVAANKVTRVQIYADTYVALTVTGAMGHAVVSGNSLTVAVPTTTGGSGTNTYDLQWTTAASGGSGFADCTGQTYNSTNGTVSWTVPTGQLGQLLLLHMIVSDGTSSYTVGALASDPSRTDISAPVYVPAPAIPTFAAVSGLMPSNAKIVCLGDSLTEQYFGIALPTLLTGIQSNLGAANVLNLGHRYSAVDDWSNTSRSTTETPGWVNGVAPTSGQVGYGTNNYNNAKAQITALLAAGVPIPAITIDLGTNHRVAGGTANTASLYIMPNDADYLALLTMIRAIPGAGTIPIYVLPVMQRFNGGDLAMSYYQSGVNANIASVVSTFGDPNVHFDTGFADVGNWYADNFPYTDGASGGDGVHPQFTPTFTYNGGSYNGALAVASFWARPLINALTAAAGTATYAYLMDPRSDSTISTSGLLTRGSTKGTFYITIYKIADGTKTGVVSFTVV